MKKLIFACAMLCVAGCARVGNDPRCLRLRAARRARRARRVHTELAAGYLELANYSMALEAQKP